MLPWMMLRHIAVCRKGLCMSVSVIRNSWFLNVWTESYNIYIGIARNSVIRQNTLSRCFSVPFVLHMVTSKMIKTNYPDVFEKLVSSHMVFAKTGMSEFLEQAKKEGFIWKHINERFFISILEMNMYYSSKTEFLRANAPFGEETVKIMVLYTLLRGVSTARGIEYIDDILDKQKTE